MLTNRIKYAVNQCGLIEMKSTDHQERTHVPYVTYLFTCFHTENSVYLNLALSRLAHKHGFQIQSRCTSLQQSERVLFDLKILLYKFNQ